MPKSIHETTWDEVQALRGRIATAVASATVLEHAAKAFVDEVAATFSTVVLARLFLVAPLRRLPAVEQAAAAAFAASAGRVGPIDAATPVLSLLASAGAEPAWNVRTASRGHRAIPLVDERLVDGTPMIAALLASLDVDLPKLRGDPSVQLRNLLGGLNARFFVPDAADTRDAQGRHIIAARDFVTRYGVRSVFGMGGAFLDGLVAVAIVFTRELLTATEVDRFPSLIGTFKIAADPLLSANALFAP